jgi:WD40 repeat protein
MSEFSHDLAVVIGINQYGSGIAPLQTAVNDVEELARILKYEHGYEVVQLVDQQATLEALQHLLDQELPNRTKENGRLLVYFAGHGIALNGDDGPEGYLIPQDAKLGDTSTYLSMPKLQTAVSELPCRHFLGILDCCFAGAFRWSSTRDLLIAPEVIHKERYDRFIQDPAWQTITSAAYDQKALDSLAVNSERGQTGKHSPFAAALIEALAGKADVYPPPEPGKLAGDGVITATELYLYLRDRVEPPTEALRHRQTPGIWPLKKHDKGEYIFLSPGHVLNLPPAPPLDESKNPYRGLQSFEAEQSDLFFGRSVLTEKISELVSQQPLSAVLGASGSGKSSLVKAGLIPYLKQQDAQATQSQWKVLAPIRPGESPFKVLSKALEEENVLGVSIPEAGSEAGVEMLTQYMAAWSQQHPGMKLLLAIDQFEELITLCRDEKERERFLSGLAQAVTAYPAQLRLVLTLRSDFEPHFQDGLLKEHWSGARFMVPPMTRSELREAIEEPASKRVMYFQSDDLKNPLVDQLIDEVADMPGALPLLSFILSELYLKYLRRQKIAKDQGESIDRSITEVDYKELGGVVRSLTQRADQEYEAAQLESVDAIIIRNVMLRMVAVSGGELTRRRVQKAELIYPEPKNEQVQKLIDRFSTVRLLVEGLDIENQEYVEPAHDQLVIGWGKIKTWLNERQEKVETGTRWTPIQTWFTERSAKIPSPLRLKAASKKTARPEAEQPLKVNLQLQRELTTAANHWNSKKAIDGNRQAIGFLWNGDPRLPQLEQTQQSEDNWFNKQELEFVNRSIQQKRNNFHRLVGTIAVVFTMLSGLTIYAFYRQREALLNQANSLGEYSSVLFDSHKEFDALIESIRAGRILQNQNATDPVVLAALQKSLYGVRERNRLVAHDGEIFSIVFSPNGQTFASTRRDVKLWDKNGQLLSTLPERTGVRHGVNGVAFSPDSQMLATARGDDKVEVWDLKGKLLHSISGRSKSEIMNMAFSPDGKTIISVANDGTVATWSLGGQLIKSTPGNQDNIQFVSFSPNSRMIITAGWYGDVKLRNSEGQLINILFYKNNHDTCYFGQNGNHTKCIAFSSDNKTIISTNGEKAEFWNTRGERLKIFSTHQARVDSVVISPDNKTIAFVSNNASVDEIKLYNFEGRLLSTLHGHNSHITCIAFSPDSKILTSSDGSGIIKIWDTTEKNLPILTGHTDFVVRVIFSHNGKMLASTSYDGTVKLWDRKGTLLHDFSIDRGLGTSFGPSIAFSPDDKTIAIGSNIVDGDKEKKVNTLALWDLKGHRLIPNIKSRTPVYNVAFYGNNTLLSTTGGVILWNRKGQVLHALRFPHSRAQTAAFSPDGEIVIGGDRENNIFLWNRKGQLIHKILTEMASSYEFTFSPDSKIFTTTNGSSFVTLWNREGQKIRTLSESQGKVGDITFSPDNKMLATVSLDGTVKLWDLKGHLLNTLSGHQKGVESAIFSPDSKIIASAGDDGLIKLWSRDGALLTTFSGHQGKIYSITFSPDGQTLASGSADNIVILWNLKDLQQDSLMKNACNWMRDYLHNPKSQDIGRRDRTLCDGV